MVHELEKFRVEEEVRKARVLAQTLASTTGPCDAEGNGRLVWALRC